MKYEIRSKSSLLSMILVTLLVGLALSADARVANTRFLNEHGFIELSNSHRMRGNARRLVGTTSKASAADTDDATTTADDTDDTVSSGGQKSIASRTSSVPAKKRDDLFSSMSAHFVKPSTLAPSAAPPTPATVAPKKTAEKASMKKTDSTSTSTGTTSNSSPTPAEAAPTTTMYPTKADPEGSFASRTTTDGTANVPLSASMEFETAQTSIPVASNSTKLYSMQKPPTKNTTATEEDEDDYIPLNGTTTYKDDLVSTFLPQNATSEPTGWIFPKEKKEPEEWPLVVGGMFVLAAIAFFGATVFQNYRKRKDYEKIPVSLTV